MALLLSYAMSAYDSSHDFLARPGRSRREPLARASDSRTKRPRPRQRWSQDVLVTSGASVEPREDQRRPFGAKQLIGLIFVMLTLVVWMVSSRAEDHSRYGAGPEHETASVSAPSAR